MTPWAAAAASLTIVLVVLASYYIFLGVRYWQESRRLDSQSAEITRIDALLRAGMPDQVGTTAALAKTETQLQQLRAIFKNTDTNAVLRSISATARESSVRVTSITVGHRQQSKAIDGLVFETLPVALALQGERVAVERFLAGLHQKMPGMAVGDLQMVDIEATVSVQVQLVFYLSAQAAAVENKSEAS